MWSLALRKGGPAKHPAVPRLTALLEGNEDVVVAGIVVQEVLQAFRSEAAFASAARHLEPFPILEATRAVHLEAARLHRRCASKGISASTVDCLIAQLAIEHRARLLSADEDFGRIARHSDLQLA